MGEPAKEESPKNDQPEIEKKEEKPSFTASAFNLNSQFGGNENKNENAPFGKANTLPSGGSFQSGFQNSFANNKISDKSKTISFGGPSAADIA